MYIGERNLMLGQQQHHCFTVKQDAHHIKIVFYLKARKRFVFCFSDEETETYFGVVIFWDVWRNCFLKNEKCIIFSKSRCVNSSPPSFFSSKMITENI